MQPITLFFTPLHTVSVGSLPTTPTMDTFSAQECSAVLRGLGVTAEAVHEFLQSGTVPDSTLEAVMQKCKELIAANKKIRMLRVRSFVQSAGFENCCALREQIHLEGLQKFYEGHGRAPVDLELLDDFCYEFPRTCWCDACPGWRQQRFSAWISSAECPYATCWHARCVFFHGDGTHEFACDVVPQEFVNEMMHTSDCLCNKERCAFCIDEEEDYPNLAWESVQEWYTTCNELLQAMKNGLLEHLCNPSRIPEEYVPYLYVWYEWSMIDEDMGNVPTCICGHCS